MSETATTGQAPAKPKRGRPKGSKNATGDSKARTQVKAEDIETIPLADIDAAELAVNINPLLVSLTAPIRKRSEQQAAMDAVGKRAYQAWVDAGRPSAWGKVPSVTYFVPPERVEHYKYLIRRTADFLQPIPRMEYVRDENGDRVPERDENGNVVLDDNMDFVPAMTEVIAPGVRYRYGTEFTLTPELAERIGRPDDVGKTVLTWAMVDKRGRASADDESGEATEDDEADDESAEDDE
jgi:hypothetical protein